MSTNKVDGQKVQVYEKQNTKTVQQNTAKNSSESILTTNNTQKDTIGVSVETPNTIKIAKIQKLQN